MRRRWLQHALSQSEGMWRAGISPRTSGCFPLTSFARQRLKNLHRVERGTLARCRDDPQERPFSIVESSRSATLRVVFAYGLVGVA